MIRVVLYARVSSSKKSESLSIQGQLHEMRVYAEDHDWQIYREFVDQSHTGHNDQRPAFLEMIEEAQTDPGLFSAILVWKYSRFSRSRQDSRLYKMILRQHGVAVISINESREDSSDKLLEEILEVIDEHYVRNASEDTQMALNQKKPCLAPKIIEPDYAKVVQQIFDLCIAGSGIGSIVKSLNEANIPRVDEKPWNADSVYKILKNQVCASVVSWEVFQQAQISMQQRRITKSSRVYLFNGLLHCGFCHSKMIGQVKTPKYSYYRCYQYSKGKCQQKMVRCDQLDKMVVQQCMSIIQQKFSHVLCDLVQQQIAETPGTLTQQIDALQYRLDQHYDAFELGQISIEYLKPRIEKLFHEIAELKQQREAISGVCEPQATLSCCDLHRIWRKMPMSERKDWIVNFIERIEYRGEDVMVVYRF